MPDFTQRELRDIRYILDPVRFATERLGLRPDAIQARILASTAARGILCCTRQWGKSTIIAAKAVHHALFQPQSTILVAAPTERQSAELVYKCREFLVRLDIPRRGDGLNRVSLLFPNGSRIVGLPNQELGIRGFSAPALILIDEAACVPDALYYALLPMQATNDGALWLLSTPREKRGFFYNEWHAPDTEWAKFKATALECPRISANWLNRRARRIPKAVFEQEFLCVFRSSHNTLFSDEDLHRAAQPLPAPAGMPVRVYIGLDLGQRADHAAIAVLYFHQVPLGRRNPTTWAMEYRHFLHLRQIHQIPLGTPYPEIARLIRDLLQHFEIEGRATLIVDAGGPGLPFIDFLRTQSLPAHLIKLNITSAGTPHLTNGLYHASRAQLLTNLSLLLENRAILIPDDETLLTELRAIQSNFTSQADHDDLVMALALAAWQANRNWPLALAS